MKKRRTSCACAGCLAIIVLVIPGRWVAEHFALGEPRRTLPADLCSGQLVEVLDGMMGRRIAMRELSLLKPGVFTMRTWPVREVGNTRWGTVAVEDRKKIRVHFRDGRERLYRGPGPPVFRVAWSPDGRFIAYTYEFGMFGIASRLSENHAVGILDLGSGTNYRLRVDPIGHVYLDQKARIQWEELK